MSHTTRGRRRTAGDSLRRQALGLGVLLLVLSLGYAGSRLPVADSPEQAVEIVAEEPAQSTPDIIEINAHIVEVATRYGIEPRLVAAIVAVESQFDTRAVSRRGAEGLMQLMPATAADLDVQDSFDPRDNIEGGVRHLKRLMARFHNDVPLALAAYNAGEQAVVNYRGIPPYRETRQYVVRVLRRYDREAARAVAQKLAAPRAAAPRAAPPAAAPRAAIAPLPITQVTYVDSAVAVPLMPVPARVEEIIEVVGAPPDRKPSESP